MAAISPNPPAFFQGVFDKTLGELFRISKNRKTEAQESAEGEIDSIQEFDLRKEQTLERLSLLQTAREELISDIMMKRRYDFKVFFKYEDNHRVLAMAFTQYFMEWINAQIKRAFFTSLETGTAMVRLLGPVLEEELHLQAKDIQTIDTQLPLLFEEKIAGFKALTEVENISEEKLNQLDFTIERENALFNRLWKTYNTEE